MPAVANLSPTGNAYIDGVLGDVKWAVSTLTYSFPTSASYYGTNYGEGEPLNQFAALNSTQQATVRSALTMFSSVANITFAEKAESATQHADLRFAMSNDPSTAWAYLPSTAAEGGDAWFNKSSGWYSNPAKGNYANATFLHEIGHSLGLEHAHEHYVMPQDRDSMEYTIMSYRSYVGASTTGGYTNETGGYAQSLMMYDIAALQHMYGANFNTLSDSTTYRWSATTGEMFIDGVGQGVPVSNRIFQTIWDGGGVDTYDLSAYTTNLKLDLRPGEWTTTSSAQLAKLKWDGSKLAAGNIANALQHDGDARSLIENAVGGSGHDTIIGNQAANSLNGGAGDDKLTGGAGADILDGGLGTDTACFSGLSTLYSCSQLADGWLQISDLRGSIPDGVDKTWSIEFFQFADKTLSFADLLAGTPSTVDQTPTTTLTLTGDGAANILNGGLGNDVLDGRAGNDKLNGFGGDDLLFGGAGSDRLDGGAGTDTASYETAARGVNADLLHPKYNTQDARGDQYVSIENLTGSSFSDVLSGNDSANTLDGGSSNDTLFGRSGIDSLLGGDGFDFLDGGLGNDVLSGGSGNDTLYGGFGADHLSGGAGSDIFQFRSIGDSLQSGRDTVSDFTSGLDKIDLRSIDANISARRDQAFTYLGDAAFTGRAGQLHFVDGVLSGDTNGDGLADFEINVSSITPLVVTDFYL
ncbi:M10 family metallopeptidase C-terminal domain-containing protein [Flaviflagellibacter deserti]|uniref:M10 family metallopeptidase C-terminal domain-containing protein n=1 Tax=Flaviflagellibacter deserti TaxID=2267266 RepID=A0ABV9YYP7_9HYPH